MSAFVGMDFKDRIEIVSDGAICDLDGVLIGKQLKIWASDRFPLAVTGVGGVTLFNCITGVVRAATENSATVEQAIALIEDGLPTLGIDEQRHGRFATLIAYWSTRGPQLLKFRNVPDSLDGPIPPLKVIPALGNYGSGPGLTYDQLKALGVTFRDGLRTDGVTMLDAMRKIGQPGPNGGDTLYWIGGYVDHATIDKDGVRIDRIHEWPDVVGEKIRA